jgi:hypothetical protein
MILSFSDCSYHYIILLISIPIYKKILLLTEDDHIKICIPVKLMITLNFNTCLCRNKSLIFDSYCARLTLCVSEE